MIDALPPGPEWTCELLEVKGDILDEQSGAPQTEVVELWRRNTVECVQELIGNPEFEQYMKYTPYRLYTNEDGTDQCWDEMATGSWWWDIQVRHKGLSMSDADDEWIGGLTRGSYRIAHYPCKRQDPANGPQRRQASMACISHNREHRQEDPTMPICEGHHPGWVLTGHEARMPNRSAEGQCRLPAVPSMYGIVAGTAEDSGQGGDGNDMRRWMGTQSVSHPGSIRR